MSEMQTELTEKTGPTGTAEHNNDTIENVGEALRSIVDAIKEVSHAESKLERQVTFDENQNTVKEIPALPPSPPEHQLKPDTPKIPVKQYQYKFLVTDTYTDSIVGLYPSNRTATKVIIDLVKQDIMVYIEDYNKKLLYGESIEENRRYLAMIKALTYQYKTINDSLQTFIQMEDGMAKNRYRIIMIKEDEREISNVDFTYF